MKPSWITKKGKMGKKLILTSFSLKAIVLYLSLFGISLSYVKTEKVKVLIEKNDEAASNASNIHPLIFFMHDILGGSAPSERIVAGTIVNTQTSNLPFSKPNNRVFPFKGRIPLFETSIGSTPESTGTKVIKNIDKNKVFMNRNSLPYVTPNQLPPGATLENLLFGRITVIDDDITKGHELGSVVIGKAQGFHLASSLDGSSRTMAFAALFHSEDHDDEDSISFFGIHRTPIPESYIAVVGGTGKYDSVKGYAKIETLHLPEQHSTNGVEILLRITVCIS